MGFWLLGCLVFFYWLYASHPAGLNLLAGFLAIVLAGLSVLFGLQPSPSGWLVWDGHVWRWESTGYQVGVAEYEVVVAADFQHAVLLRLDNPAKARLWIWAERSASPERWLDFRRAIYSPHRQPALQAAPG